MKLRAASPIILLQEIKYNELEENDPKALCDKLAKMFMSKTLVNKLFLKKDLFEIKMEEKGDLKEHLNKINQLAGLDKTIKSEDKALMLLVSVSKEYNTDRASLLVGKTTLDFDETLIVLKADKFMKQDSKSSSGDGGTLVAVGHGCGNRKAGKGCIDLISSATISMRWIIFKLCAQRQKKT